MDLTNIDPSVRKWIVWVLILSAARTSRPIRFANFIALNPLIRRLIQKYNVIKKQDVVDKERLEGKVSNLISSGFLLSSVVDNAKFPADYGIIYIWSNYIGELNPPSHSQILVSPKSSPYFKILHYNSPRLRQLYNNKQFLIYPLIFAQILSNYLTPTKHKLNQRYLSSSIKSRILNPIWINYSLGIKSQSLNWSGLITTYFKHNLAFMAIYGLISFKKRIVDHYYELKHQVYEANGLKTLPQIIKNYMWYIFHKANSLTNFIYVANLASILLISLTSPLMKYINNSVHNKILFKNYVKLIGVVSGFIAVYANSMDLIPDMGYTPTNYDDFEPDSDNLRRISDGFLDALSLYLFRLIVLQKWRIIKENHPWFKIFKLKTWNRFEALIFCFGIFKLMNLNDFLKTTTGKDYGLRNNSLVKLIDRFM